MAGPGQPERNRVARSFGQLRRFHHGINSDRVLGTHTVSATELKAALWAVYKNETSFVSLEFATRLLSAAQTKPTKIDSGLSRREMQILLEVVSGATNRMVAEKLSLSEKTVKHYMSSIMQKYGVTNRTSAVMASQKMLQSSQHA
jgi:two-component system, NarL family, nitrate/nitrite response regulator NarL